MLEQVQTTEATQPVTSATTQSTQETSQPILSTTQQPTQPTSGRGILSVPIIDTALM